MEKKRNGAAARDESAFSPDVFTQRLREVYRAMEESRSFRTAHSEKESQAACLICNGPAPVGSIVFPAGKGAGSVLIGTFDSPVPEERLAAMIGVILACEPGAAEYTAHDIFQRTLDGYRDNDVFEHNGMIYCYAMKGAVSVLAVAMEEE